MQIECRKQHLWVWNGEYVKDPRRRGAFTRLYRCSRNCGETNTIDGTSHKESEIVKHGPDGDTYP